MSTFQFVVLCISMVAYLIPLIAILISHYCMYKERPLPKLVMMIIFHYGMQQTSYARMEKHAIATAAVITFTCLIGWYVIAGFMLMNFLTAPMVASFARYVYWNSGKHPA